MLLILNALTLPRVVYNPLILMFAQYIHGGIDGFSRAVVYLTCHNNNRAETLSLNFLQLLIILVHPVECGQTREWKMLRLPGLC